MRERRGREPDGIISSRPLHRHAFAHFTGKCRYPQRSLSPRARRIVHRFLGDLSDLSFVSPRRIGPGRCAAESPPPFPDLDAFASRASVGRNGSDSARSSADARRWEGAGRKSLASESPMPGSELRMPGSVRRRSESPFRTDVLCRLPHRRRIRTMPRHAHGSLVVPGHV